MLLRTCFLKHVISRNFSSRKCISEYLVDLSQRGLVAQSYPSNILTDHRKNVDHLPSVIYAGFDPTAESLHIGNLLVLLNLLRASQFHIKPIAIVGGATATIGDPSGRNSEREEVKVDIVKSQATSIKNQLMNIATNTEIDLKILDNNDWFKNMTMTEYLRVCKHHRLGEMLRMGAIKNRMTDNNGISFTEFSYQTMQAYDWLHLSRTENCFFQIGGSDQLGHLDLGAHYIKRVSNKFAGGVCLPLVTDSSGKKLGKSVGAAVWLSPEKTSPFHFFQFFRQLHDTDATQLLTQFSLKPYNEVISIVDNHQKNLGKWIAQDALAKELTIAVHGKSGLEIALRCTRALYHGTMEDIVELTQDQLLGLFGLTIKVPRDMRKMKELAAITRQDKQKGEVLMTKGAFKVNGEKVTDPEKPINIASLILPKTENLTLVCWGKRKFQLVEWL